MLDDPAVPLIRADLIVEWAVATKRGVPWPSTLNDVVWGAFYESSINRRLPRSAFEPPPAVDAGVLVFRRRPVELIAPESVDGFRHFVADGFRRGLRAVAPPRTIKRVAGRGVTARDLDAYQWAEIFLNRLGG
jgi:16S rRNA A1518/A1519 N6-dimethyltransferase RsmA/KsgA/DIM1 with predicted DNA glycosylase/AP lyase activity